MSEITPVHGASTDRDPVARSITPLGPATIGWSKHRVEALTDGIFAVAMTLLVIDLKLSDHAAIHTQADPELCHADMPEATYHAARLRIGDLVLMGAVAPVIARSVIPVYATVAYMLMVPVGRYSRHIEARNKTRA